MPGPAGPQWRGQIHAHTQHRRPHRLDSGGIQVFGQPANSAAARAELGWAPQELALYPLLTCRENLEAFGQYQGLRGKKRSAAPSNGAWSGPRSPTEPIPR